jgi:hypothetical protein
MGDMHAKTDVKEATIEAVVIRADGSREDLGVVSAYYRNPIKRAMWALKQKLERK